MLTRGGGGVPIFTYVQLALQRWMCPLLCNIREAGITDMETGTDNIPSWREEGTQEAPRTIPFSAVT